MPASGTSRIPRSRASLASGARSARAVADPGSIESTGSSTPRRSTSFASRDGTITISSSKSVSRASSAAAASAPATSASMYSPARTRSTATGLRCAFSRKRSSGRRLHVGEHARAPAGEDRLGDADHEPAGGDGALADHGEPQLREQRARALDQSIRGLRQAHAPPGPLAQAHAELQFERVDALGHRGLRDAQPGRRAAHGAVLGERGQGFELVDHERFPIGLYFVNSIPFSPPRRSPILRASEVPWMAWPR